MWTNSYCLLAAEDHDSIVTFKFNFSNEEKIIHSNDIKLFKSIFSSTNLDETLTQIENRIIDVDAFNKLLRKFNKEIPYNLPRVTFDSFSSSFSILKNNINQKIQYKKQYKILKCPKCKQKLRVPRGKGKITVTCKRCSHEFHAKS